MDYPEASKLTKELAAKVAAAKDFSDIKNAVVAYIEKMDTEAHILGDGDLLGLANAAMERRGKRAGTAKAGK